MKFISLFTIFSMLFSFSAFAGNRKHTIKTRYVTVCEDVIFEKASDFNDFKSIFAFSLEESRRLKDISGSTYAFISEYSNDNDLFIFSTERKKEESYLLDFEVIASGSIGSPVKWQHEDYESGEKLEGISQTKWVQFHISANEHTSPKVRGLVREAKGTTVYGICHERSIKN